MADSAVKQSDDEDFVGKVEWQLDGVRMSADPSARFETDEESRDPWLVTRLRDFLGHGTRAASEGCWPVAAAITNSTTAAQSRHSQVRLHRRLDLGVTRSSNLPPFSGRSFVRKSVVVICPELPGWTQQILWGPGCPLAGQRGDLCGR